MKQLLLIALGLCVVLSFAVAGCTTTQVQTASQASEKIDTAAAELYVAIATYENQDEFTNPANTSKDEAFKLKAWNDYQIVHVAYEAGQVLSMASLATLNADQTAAKGQ